jgi:NTE family protein
MAEVGVDVRNADLFVGTSAGARVALDLTSGMELDEIYKRRVGREMDALHRPAMVDWTRLRAGVEAAKQAGGSPAEILRRYGALALTSAVETGSDRRTGVASQLPLQVWRKQRVLITAVNAETGERRAFDRDSGIDLVDAILATTASFGSPPMFFEGQHYIDGGYHSGDNADLAIGFERVLILSLRAPPEAMRLIPLECAVEALQAAGAQVEVIHPDEQTLAALVKTGGPMNPASGRSAAVAGRLQGQRAAVKRIASFWR